MEKEPLKRTPEEIHLARYRLAVETCKEALDAVITSKDDKVYLTLDDGELVEITDPGVNHAVRRALYALQLASDAYLN